MLVGWLIPSVQLGKFDPTSRQKQHLVGGQWTGNWELVTGNQPQQHKSTGQKLMSQRG